MILSGQMERVQEQIRIFTRDIRSLIKEAIELSYFSRGSVQYQSVLLMSAVERDLLREFLEKRLEDAKKMMYPVF